MTGCNVEGCSARHFGHGLCEKHYARLRKTGSVNLRPDPRRVARSTTNGLRICCSCKVEQPESQFHADASRWDGLARACKTCLKAATARRMTPERIAARRARVKARREANLAVENERRRAAYATDGSRDRAHAQRRRAARSTPEAEDFTDREIFDRDGWICGLCGEAIDPNLRWPHPGSVSLDHIIPLAQGGGHTRANVQAACLRCNLSKGARVAS